MAADDNGNTPVTDSTRPAPAEAEPAVAARKYLLERVDDAAVVQLYADGFQSLPLDQKTLIWHLYQAALAGRDIYYDQRYAHNLEMREVPVPEATGPGSSTTHARMPTSSRVGCRRGSPERASQRRGSEVGVISP